MTRYSTEEAVFPHKCIEEDCETIVQFDDEPWCFTHEPDEGAWVARPGYSARKEADVVKNGQLLNVLLEVPDEITEELKL